MLLIWYIYITTCRPDGDMGMQMIKRIKVLSEGAGYQFEPQNIEYRILNVEGNNTSAVRYSLFDLPAMPLVETITACRC